MKRCSSLYYESQDILFVGLIQCLAMGGFFLWLNATRFVIG